MSAGRSPVGCFCIWYLGDRGWYFGHVSMPPPEVEGRKVQSVDLGLIASVGV